VDLGTADKEASNPAEKTLISSGVDYRSIEGSTNDNKNHLDRQQQDQPAKDDFEKYVRERTVRYNRELAEVRQR
jgi:hypothetical protein